MELKKALACPAAAIVLCQIDGWQLPEAFTVA
jgi:hypothetical protein